MPVVSSRGTVSVSSLGSFLSVGSSSKPYYPHLTLFIIVHHIQYSFKKKRVGKKNASSYRRRRPRMGSRVSK